MKVITRTSLLLAAALAFMAAAVNAQPAMYVEGTHYQEISDPVRTVDPSKIEVTEVFWYGCPHCYAMEPLIENWEQGLAEDVVFVRSPGMWNEMMETHAKIYYVAEELGALDKIHGAAFDAIHQRGNYLQTEEAVRQFFVAQGVDPAEFDEAWSSFGINSAVRQAGARMRDYGVRGVPSLVVNGKYLITAGGAVPTQQDMLEIADYLVQQERAAQ